MVLNVEIKNRVATYKQGTETPICGNSGDQIKFKFDEEWGAYEKKTARFIWCGKYHDVEFTGDTCEIPVISNTQALLVGVFSGEIPDDEDAISTTLTSIGYLPSVRCGDRTASNGTGANYTNEARGYAEEARTAAEEARTAADSTAAHAEEAAAALIVCKTLDFITPEMFSLGDANDDTQAVQTAIDNGVQLGKPIYLSKRYLTSDTIRISGNNILVCGKGIIDYSGTGDAVRVDGVNNKIDLWEIEAEKGTGIALDGHDGYCDRNHIRVKRIISKTGLAVRTDNKPIYANKFEIQSILPTDIGVLVWANASFINENHYHIDNIIGGGNVGVYLHATEGLNFKGGQGTNDNKFFNTRFEGIKNAMSDTSGYTENLTQTCAILIENSHGNVFRACRTQENYGNKCLVFKGSCHRNDIELSDLNITKGMDITALTNEESRNIIKTTRELQSGDGYSIGYAAEVYGNLGFVYDIDHSGSYVKALKPSTSPDNIIGLIDGIFPTIYEISSADCNGLTYTIDSRFSTHGTMMCGKPINLYLGNNSLVTIVDDKGQVVLDNTDGARKWKTVSIRFVCYDRPNEKNRWEVIVTQ